MIAAYLLVVGRIFKWAPLGSSDSISIGSSDSSIPIRSSDSSIPIGSMRSQERPGRNKTSQKEPDSRNQDKYVAPFGTACLFAL